MTAGGRTVRAESWAARADAERDYAKLAHTRHDWIGALASVDREKRARFHAAELYDGAAQLSRAIGDVDGARRYKTAAAWERDCASVL